MSLYLDEGHSALADQMLCGNRQYPLTQLHRAEWAHAVAQHLFRRDMNEAKAVQLHAQLEDDVSSGLWLQTAMPENAFTVCAELARRYAPKLGVRTLDSLHVACALELKATHFWTFDERQAKLAKVNGLPSR